ncbi:MAG TPA: DEAD/DEAH box helicase [Nitrososphaerales archaeon]|nr:DEAD/DEAH box helicase [Nitrososphaerales archaeon]
MRLEEANIPDELVKYFREKGITEFYPPQEQAIRAGLLEGRSLVVSSPTACYDSNTEVLTKEGWKLFKDTEPHEEVLSMNPETFEMEYVTAVKKIEFPYTGTMVSVKGKEIDFRVTGNHNMYVCRASERKARVRGHPRPYRRTPAEFQFVTASRIHYNWKFKSDGIWRGRKIESFELPEMVQRGRHPSLQMVLPAVRIPIFDWLNFLGWYMAEGNARYGGNRYEVTLCQRKDPDAAKDALVRLGLARVYITGRENHQHFSVYSPQLATYLSQFGKAPEKFVPDFVKDLPPEDIRVFLEAYSRGDGSPARDGISPVFGTSSRRLADDVQELLLKVGISSLVRNRGIMPPHSMPDGHVIKARYPLYEVAGRRFSEHGIDYRKPSKPRFEVTRGEMVYCLTLPRYHLLYVRRNGRAFWCGNSGKTMLALLAAYAKVKQGRKVVYLAPLRALASEKYSEFSEFSRFGITTTISTGDYDTSGESLGRSEIIVLTNERFDSVMRHRVSWINSVGLFIADEVHLAGNDSRGPTLEMILTKVLHLGLDAQLLALSATISNAKTMADWLRATSVELDWRPVPLKEGAYDYGRIVFTDGEEKQVPRSTYGAPIDVAMDTLKGGGQALVFASTRRRAVSLATRAAELTQRQLSPGEKKAVSEAARRILASGEETSLSRLLAEVVAKGSAFHHAGLEAEHRKIVEDYYRARAIKLLAATPTLASGVNLPARRVVVADMSRYDAERGGNAEISVLEYRQMAGRAGRPQYDDHGETVMIPPPSASSAEFLEHYAKDPPEPITSRLAEESAMRSHTLATVATGSGLSKGDLDSLFSRTLLAIQVGEGEVRKLTEKALGYLLGERLLESHGSLFYATDFGRRVSILYIDPVTGVMFRDSVRRAEGGRNHTAGILHLIASTPDFEPKFPLRSKDYDQAIAFMEEHASEMLERHSSRAFADYDRVLQDMRSVMALHGWIDEWREEQLLTRLGVEPGDMHRAVDNADWLLHALGEISKLYKMPEMARQAELLRRRVVSGVSEELVELTTLQGIGRVRARALYSAGFKTLEDIKETPVERIANVEKVGTAVARKIKEQVAKY